MRSREKTLKIIDESTVQAGRFFRMYANDEERRKCLDAFTECPRIVEWMKTETKGHLIFTIWEYIINGYCLIGLPLCNTCVSMILPCIVFKMFCNDTFEEEFTIGLLSVLIWDILKLKLYQDLISNQL